MDELPDADIYVDGEFCQGLHDNANRMHYDPTLGAYTASIPLKQGAYNYQYVAVKHDGKQKADPAPVEGNKYETENEYNISVYFRPAGARADRLVGTHTIYNK